MPAASQSLSYIALGDSVTVGTGSTNNQGYVVPYGAYLGTVYGATMTVVNLGVGGETSASILGGQLTNFKNTVASEKTAGITVNTISIHIGNNDLANWVIAEAEDGYTPDQISAAMPAEVGIVQANYVKLLTAVRQQVPHSFLLLESYWNFPWYGDVAYQLYDQGNQEMDTVMQSLATQYDGRWVDNYDPFLGHEEQYLVNNQEHPNNLGYSVIVADMERVPAPDPLLTASLGVGVFSLMRRFGRRRTRTDGS
jgi:lysophospholipase L1-like esterase